MKSMSYEYQDKAVAQRSGWKVGALFMEAGTGKTKVAREIVNGTDADFCLWIGPLRTLESAQGELRKWGGLSMPSRFVGVESLSQSDRIYLETYTEVERYKRAFIVVDESLKIKNMTAKRTERVLSLREISEYRLILNGTPLARNLMDLYPQMNFLSPRIINMTEGQFKDTFCRYVEYFRDGRGGRKKIGEAITGYENVDYLYSLISPYIYECDLHLNVRQNWHERFYALKEEERKTYDGIKGRYLSFDGLEEWNGNIFMAMTQQLQQSYCTCAGKAQAVERLFSESAAKEEETLIFCKFIESQEFCRRRFPKARTLSYQKEAFGLNLQNYATTIFWDKTFDWALREQASRRTFRAGQLSDCQYFDLTGNVGLESLIGRNNERKCGMAEYFKKKSKQQIFEEL